VEFEVGRKKVGGDVFKEVFWFIEELLADVDETGWVCVEVDLEADF
jgi:hypothetical protein